MLFNKRVTVTVPATSANLGPGFDCLGLALTLYNRMSFTAVSRPGLTVRVNGVDAHKVALDETNMVVKAANVLFERVGERPSGLHVHQENQIPVGSGLGSSSTAVLGGLLAANALLEQPLTGDQVLELAVTMEGHPDNVAPALHGGLVLGFVCADEIQIEPIPVPALPVVVVLPEFQMLTATARAVLPAQVPRVDAVFNTGHMGLLIRALTEGDYDKLALAMEDRLHQPYRIPLIPGMQDAFDAARAAGAAGVALSGAGPSLLAFAPHYPQAIIEAATAAFTQAGLSSRSWILAVDKSGAQIQVGKSG